MDQLSKVIKFAQVHKHVQESIEIIERAFLKYHVENTCVSFNGGKDCTAVLHLVHSVSQRFTPNNNQPRLRVFYAQLPDHFQLESEFVIETVKLYNLELLQYSTSSLKDSLTQLKRDAPNIDAVFLGTRHDDFKGASEIPHMAQTDNDWPQFMRVNPILNWSYHQVWEFIRELQIPYCDLYNQGYTSLGTRTNTVKNTSLLRYKEGQPYYLPAWNLASPNDERKSRSENC